jgi:hypothetical protein
MQEQWREVKGAPGYYVSDMGRIRGRSGKILAYAKTKYGYIRVELCGCEPNAQFVHRMVLTAFVGDCPEGMVGRHLNGDSTDNRLCNLAWSTQKDNLADRAGHGTLPKGARNGMTRLTEEQVVRIRAVKQASNGAKKWGATQLAKEFGVGLSTISNVARSQSWKHLEQNKNEQ